MAKCIGNCAICELDVDKQWCCQCQTLRLLVEVKQMLKSAQATPVLGKTLADVEGEVELPKSE